MNNVISILVDSVDWNCISNKRTRVSLTPFIDMLSHESIVANNLYSQGPYTDAATKSLYTGMNCLDDFGYFFKLNTSSSTHFNVFHNNGFETYGLYYPYYLLGKSIRQSIDHRYFTSGFLFESEYGGIFYHYSEIIKQRDLSKEEETLLIERTELMFECWIDFYSSLINDENSSLLIRQEISLEKIYNSLAQIESEFLKFDNNKELYIHELLVAGKNHQLFKIDSVNVDALINRSYLTDSVYKKYNHFYKRIGRYNFLANFINDTFSFKRIVCGLWKWCRFKDKSAITFAHNYWKCLNVCRQMKKNSYKHNWQNVPSTQRQFDAVTSILKKRQNDNKPFYLSMHLLDPHEFISFFSYDIQDDELMKEEFGMLSTIVKQLKWQFKGSLPYYLSIRYFDYCFEKFCNNLKKMNLWDNTVIMIVADHGSSFCYYPLHGRQVNCFDEECYHVPLLIRKPFEEPRVINKRCSSKDVFPTLYTLMSMNYPSSIVGKPITNDDESKRITVTEYMGPGCPDMLNREIWMSTRDEHFIVGYKVRLNDCITYDNICEFYDLKNDPKGLYNISNKVNCYDIDYMIEEANTRLKEIAFETNKFLQKINKR